MTMLTADEQLRDELLEKVHQQIQDRLPGEKGALVARFVNQFYARSAPGDLTHSSPEQLYGAALALLQFGYQRAEGQALVRVYNPQVDQHSWQSNHSVVEMINDDMPFLVASVLAELRRRGVVIHLLIHPVVHSHRDESGRLLAITDHGHGSAEHPEQYQSESWTHLTIERQESAAALETLREALQAVLADVRAVVEDWPEMRNRIRETTDALTLKTPHLDPEDVAEAVTFLSWIDDDPFVFLAVRDFVLVRPDGTLGASRDARVQVVADSGLGVMRDQSLTLFGGMMRDGTLPAPVLAFLQRPDPLWITKASRLATVHRSAAMDVVLVKTWDESGTVTGGRLFAGLFASVAYARAVEDIPWLRRKVKRVLGRSGFNARDHDSRRLMHVLSNYPRDELFQIDEDELFTTAINIVLLHERQHIALFTRVDPLRRFVSCLIYVPRDRYDTDFRRAVQAVLENAFQGPLLDYYAHVTDSPLARLHCVVRTTAERLPEFDTRDVERRLVTVARRWSDLLHDALVETHGEARGVGLNTRFADAFPAGYREQFSPETAVFDISRVEEVLAGSMLALNLYRPLEAEPHQLHFKLYHSGAPVPLSDLLPLLENMDLKVVTELPFAVRPRGSGEIVWIHDFETVTRSGLAVDSIQLKERFQDVFARAWAGQMENDGFNRLVLRAGLEAREVILLRAQAKYLRQAGIRFSQEYMESTLAAHPSIARSLVSLFQARLDPELGEDRETRERGLVSSITTALESVKNLEEDQILRRFLNLTQATLRTNAFQHGRDGHPKTYLSFKLDSRAVDDLPLPRPWREVFVYCPRMEGIHLRGGKVARGGIRWSDRREDFRTEILGLMKAQMVKNAVIVPVGSKGGFVVKHPPEDGGREAQQAEGIACYRLLISGLLDITDSLDAEGRVLPPERVVRHDGDDPYLVVAADKGTATFSDIANAVSRDYGFWLDDAFASGGSAGYDHKKMGITARGAWESVKRHFRELNHDIATTPFTVIGVGDMSGDVFGNAMLLSNQIKLTAAFDHRHIFLDPDPDPARSFVERERMFALPRSSWADYDQTCLSEGGGVFERGAKTITVSPQIQARFGLPMATLPPNELVKILLASPVDLLWFGGIGTFIKASHESHADAGDKTNDAVRIDAAALRARILGEGANLGMTQQARIQAGLAGIRLNTDAIDNSAGVDCSDHEVNIKILLGDVVGRGDMTLKQRNLLLATMTDEVAALVLADNYFQNLALSVLEAAGPVQFDPLSRFMRDLERTGRLNRAVEYLPDDAALAVRQRERQGLTRPELAVLLAYGKITLYDDLLASDLPDDPWMAADLSRYFPRELRDRFPDAITRHRLRREIIATGVTNSLINRVGPAFVGEMAERTGATSGDIARAYAIVRESFQLRSLWDAVRELDGVVAAPCQFAMLRETQVLLERAVAWFLVHSRHPLDIAAEVAAHKPGIHALWERLNVLLGTDERRALEERTATFTGQGVPEALARRVAALPALFPAMDVIRIARQTQRDAPAVAAVYYGLGESLGLDWLRERARLIPHTDHWQTQAVEAMVDDLFAHQGDIARRMLDCMSAKQEEQMCACTDAWTAARRPAMDRLTQILTELRSHPTLDLARLAVAGRHVRALLAG